MANSQNNIKKISKENMLLAKSLIIGITFWLLFMLNIASVHGQSDFSLQAKFQGKNNEYTNSTDYVLIYSNITENNKICPKSDCKFEISNGKLQKNTYNPEQITIDGTLRSQTQKNNIKTTKLYPFTSDLSITEIREINGTGINLMDGKISFGKNVYSPDFEYQITNGTLTIQGKKADLVLTGNSTGY